LVREVRLRGETKRKALPEEKGRKGPYSSATLLIRSNIGGTQPALLRGEGGRETGCFGRRKRHLKSRPMVGQKEKEGVACAHRLEKNPLHRGGLKRTRGTFSLPSSSNNQKRMPAHRRKGKGKGGLSAPLSRGRYFGPTGEEEGLLSLQARSIYEKKKGMEGRSRP